MCDASHPFEMSTTTNYLSLFGQHILPSTGHEVGHVIRGN